MMTETAYDRIVRALQEHGSKINPGSGGYKCEAQCPNHDDNNASLSITALSDRSLVWCHSPECDTRDVMAALGLTMADLYDERSATYRYDDGRTVNRYYDQRGKKRFRQDDATDTSVLYHRDMLAGVQPGRTVFLVEGEADVHAIESIGGVATTAPQGAESFHKVDVSPLAGLWITVVVDQDAAGNKWATQVAEALDGVAGRFRFVRAAEGKDASDHIAAGHGLTAFVDYDPPGLAGPSTPRYGDVAALLAGGIPDPPEPQIMFRADGVALFYVGKVNVLFGDSESGKTWIALAALVEVLGSGGRAAVIDLDHNGMAETVARMIALGAKPDALADLDRFRYCEPGDAAELDFFVADLAAWTPWAVVADSLGEILPMLGLSSNSPDEYTAANRRVLTPLAAAGAAVIAVDHLPKDDGAREKGQTGTMAKRRSVNGASLRVTVRDQFTPGYGGSASLTISKDRPGGLRGHCPPGKNAPAGRFVMVDNGAGSLSWHVTTPSAADTPRSAPDEDLAELDGLVPPPKSQRDLQERLNWGGTRALAALRKWRDLQECAD
jgi:5S rRNA maturation endonuclease (ribonuclease M5)